MAVRLAIFSNSRMTNEMKGVWDEFKSKAEIQLVEAIFKDAILHARRIDREMSADVYVSAGATAALLRRYSTTPVVTIRVTGFDLLRSMMSAQRIGGKIAVVNFEHKLPELEEIQDLLKLSVTNVVYAEQRELVDRIRDLKRSGIDTVIGHSLACALAEKAGLQSVLVYTKESVRQALDHACEMAASRRQEVEKAERLKTILDYIHSGVIATDDRGRITVFNKAAADIIGTPAEEAIGQPVDKIMPGAQIHKVVGTKRAELNQLQKIGGSHIFTNRVPIRVHNEVVGVVATFQDIGTIQQSAGQIRKDLHQKGLFAKFTFDDIIGRSPALLNTLDLAKKYAGSESTVMVTGETGTGKELLAQSIHNFSPRRSKPFVAVNCAALPETLLESELFGYDEGAFTGAKRGGKVGLFELAHTGTIFLDEIGEVPASLQSRLLRVLQEREVMRVGSDRVIRVDVRVITATNADLWHAVQTGKMRSDLYYRLNVLHVQLPALRERKSDIPLIAKHLLKKFNFDISSIGSGPLNSVFEKLEIHSWPGNVRELQNVVERLTVLMRGSDFSPDQVHFYLNEALQPRARPALPASTAAPAVARKSSRPERPSQEEITRVLASVAGNKAEAARILGVSRMTLWRRLAEHRETEHGRSGV